MSSGELEKFEYLTGKDLGYKPDVIQKEKFEYSPFGKAFNKGLDESDKKEGLLKRLKNIEGKNEQNIEAIKDHGEKQLDAIEKQKENKPKIIENDEIVYLEDKIDELFEKYPNSFIKQGKNLLRKLVENEIKINYKNLADITLLRDGSIHETSYLKKYGTLYSLLKDLLTGKVTVSNANDAQK